MMTKPIRVFNRGRNNYNFNISMNNKPHLNVHCTKFLGVYIDNKLSWKDHVQYVSAQILRDVGILSKLKFTRLPQRALRLIYLSLYLPHLSYCCSIWSSTTKSILNKLFILQKRAVRHITCSGPRDETSGLFASLNFLLHDVVNMSLVIFTFRCLNKLLLSSFSSSDNLNNSVHNYYTRV
ncbi:hypothetical protein HOLleu_26833 [Holothuria leucospilota]|uniref:Tick transposon n=1 Tax=Holothuria leucospilota TaxID=206669 RepID=A0A9Q1BPW6_HOLLE|nr:hypothetical protein HOLleu_26833 [Holothuria leucospilota]